MVSRVTTLLLSVCVGLASCTTTPPAPEGGAAPKVSGAAANTAGTIAGSLTPDAPVAPRSPTILQGSGAFTSPSAGSNEVLPPNGDGFQLSFIDVDVATVV